MRKGSCGISGGHSTATDAWTPTASWQSPPPSWRWSWQLPMTTYSPATLERSALSRECGSTTDGEGCSQRLNSGWPPAPPASSATTPRAEPPASYSQFPPQADCSSALELTWLDHCPSHNRATDTSWSLSITLPSGQRCTPCLKPQPRL